MIECSMQMFKLFKIIIRFVKQTWKLRNINVLFSFETLRF